ncbi:MAG: DUF4065 domain-containing protein [Chitinophagales bacterium]|nr:DUF4065 domain-containing protein [Chitinophagales bacterium]
MVIAINKNNQPLTKPDIRVFRKEKYNILYHYYQDSKTGKEFESDELIAFNLVQVHNQYREKHNLPFPGEIKEIREQYGVSAARMAEILGFGINQYRNYEKGEIPSISNGRLIQMIRSPKEFKRVLELSETLGPKEYTKLLKRTNELIQKKKESKWYNIRLADYLIGRDRPNEETGFVRPNLEKLCNMLSFFAVEAGEPHKTKMNKLLFYSDFLNYKTTCYSISGSKYRAIQYGPVPQNFGSLYEFADREGYIQIEYNECNDGVIQERHLPGATHTFNDSLFSEVELEAMKSVARKFGKMTTRKIVEKSHEEDAWKENVKGYQIIRYSKAFTLKTISL